jgi:hypothetical protein
MVAAFCPLGSGVLVDLFGSIPAAGRLPALNYLLGMVVIWFGPETKN